MLWVAEMVIGAVLQFVHPLSPRPFPSLLYRTVVTEAKRNLARLAWYYSSHAETYMKWCA